MINRFIFLSKSPSSLTSQVRWLRSLARITDSCQLIGTPSLAAFLPCQCLRGFQCAFNSGG
ncbi:hypothetical protein D3Z09_05975 [Rahnella aquatilis]|nr:hypothetical protein D3Z09_05975 [Rahnella aquatilis]